MPIFVTMQTSVLYCYKYSYYGDSEDKDGMVLQGVRKRESEMDGQMSCLRGVEHHG